MTVLNMDCIEGMRLMPDNSVDSIVTDPPYGIRFMGKAWDGADIDARAAKRRGFASHAPDSGPNGGHKSIAAEAGKYDLAPAAMRAFQEFSEEWAREALRVLKPGGHLLAFSSPRTYHRMACGVEDAGFELRDQIMWVFGSGFPKSRNVSKDIDKARIEDAAPTRAVCRAIRAAMDACALKSKDLVSHFAGCHPRLVDHWAARDTDSQPSVPTWAQWSLLRGLLPLSSDLDAEVWRLNERKGEAGDAYQKAEILGYHGGATPGFGEHRFAAVDASIRARSDAARQWDGWGTALKPAHEPICVARKPLVGTVAANVLAHGTGALNIDACRVTADDGVNRARPSRTPNAILGGGNGTNLTASAHNDAGRWPANLIHDGSDEVVDLFPQSAGQLADASTSDTQRAGQNVYGAMRRGRGSEPSADSANVGAVGLKMKPGARRLDTGSAARFFYCAKASTKDRGAGNTHPTVKPTDAMRYLCRLVTPPGGIVLDPFAGSGSTGKAAKLEGFLFMGFELDAEYVAIANARIEAAHG